MLYVKDTLITSGGMSSVYSGHSDTGQKVAIKQIPAAVANDPIVCDMFFSEANSLLRMSHPNVVRILDEPFEDSEGNLYLPMEFVEGKTVTQSVKDGGRFSEKKAKDVQDFGCVRLHSFYGHCPSGCQAFQCDDPSGWKRLRD